MEEKLQTSFIPKTAINVPRQRRGMSIWFLLSLLVFLLSLLLAFGAFAYKQYLSGQVSTDAASLTQAESQYQPDTIMTLERLDQRIQAAKGLLATHLAPTLLFNALSQSTLSTVSFSDFQFAPDGSGNYTVTLKGVAQSYQALALESDAMSQSGVLTAPAFSNVSLNDSGQVTFTLTASVPQNSLLFSNTLNASGTTAPSPSINTSQNVVPVSASSSPNSASTTSSISTP